MTIIEEKIEVTPSEKGYIIDRHIVEELKPEEFAEILKQMKEGLKHMEESQAQTEKGLTELRKRLDVMGKFENELKGKETAYG